MQVWTYLASMKITSTMYIWQVYALANAQGPRIVYESQDEFQHLRSKKVIKLSKNKQE